MGEAGCSRRQEAGRTKVRGVCKGASDDQTALVLSMAQGPGEKHDPCPANATAEEKAADMAQGLLDASKQEANAKMAIEAAELGRSVAAQVDSEVSSTQSGAKQMLADEKLLASKNKKNEEAEAKIRTQAAAEKAQAAKNILAEDKANARALKQQQRDENAAARDSARTEASRIAAAQKAKA